MPASSPERHRAPGRGRRALVAVVPVALLAITLVAGGRIPLGPERPNRPAVASGTSADTSADTSTDDTEALMTVGVMRVLPADSVEVTRTVRGLIEAPRSGPIGFERGGRVVAMHVDEGDVVARGDVVAVLDDRRTVAERAARLAELAQARAVLDELASGPRREDIAAARAEVARRTADRDRWRLRVERTAESRRRSAATDQELDEVQLQRDAADASVAGAAAILSRLERGTRPERIAAQRALVDALTAAVDALDVAIDEHVLRAPWDAEVARRPVDEGRVVDAGEPVLTLVERGPREARVGVDAAIARDLEADPSAQFTARVAGEAVTARLIAALPLRDRRTSTVTLRLAVASASGRVLRPGDPVEVDIRRPMVVDGGTWVPITALSEASRGLWSILVVDPADGGREAGDGDGDGLVGRVARRLVETIHVQHDRVLVRGTLREGEFVVLGGDHAVTAGQLVRGDRGVQP